jgi:hypothetical protein
MERGKNDSLLDFRAGTLNLASKKKKKKIWNTAITVVYELDNCGLELLQDAFGKFMKGNGISLSY